MSLDLESNSHQNNVKEVNPSGTAVYEFEDFRLDAAHLMLYRLTDEISLTPKQVETLLALIEKGGEIVSKDDLMNRLWPNAFVEESNLNQNIYILRKTLGDTSDGKPMIETLRRRGYRFNGELKENGQPRQKTRGQQYPEPASQLQGSRSLASSDKLISEFSEPGRSLGRNRTILVVGVLVLLLAVLGFGYYFFLRPGAAAGGNRSILILPLKPIDPATRDIRLEIGIADSLINRLNSMKGFLVKPTSVTIEYVDVVREPLAAGREQNVGYVFASTYLLADGQIRITSQLINVATGLVEEPYTFDNEAAGIFAIQNAVNDKIGNKLIARFGNTAAGPVTKLGTSNEDAYQLYLDGMFFYDKRGPGDRLKSVDKMAQAVKLDPNFALAWAGKALAHLGVMAGRYTSEDYQSAIEAINKALALDPNLSEAHTASCKNKSTYEHDRAGAEVECKRALELDPNSPIAHQYYSLLLMSSGHPDEAIAEIKTAIRLDPTSYENQRTYGILLYYDRRYDAAVVQFKQVIEMGGEQIFAVYDWLIRPLEMQGKEPEAFEGFIKYLTIRKQDDETIGRFRAAYQTAGWKGVLLERDRTFDESFSNYFRRAAWNTSLGNKDKAFEYLEISFQRHDAVIPSLLVEPIFDPLRDDPRYADLARRLGGR